MKRLLPAKSILFTALCFALAHPAVHAKTMYKWVDEKGKVSFSDQVPPSKAELGHQELDKNAQVVKVSEKAKTKAQLEVEKRLKQLRKQQEQIVAKQKAHDKKLLSSFLNVEAMDATQKNKIAAIDGQDRELRETIKTLEEELAAQHKEAARYEIKNQKVAPEVLAKMAEIQKKMAETQDSIKQLQQKKLDTEKAYTADRARYVFLSKANGTNSSPEEASVEKNADQPGIFNCENPLQCEQAWLIGKEFVKANSTAKISIDSDTLFMSEDPVSDSDLNLSVSKMTVEGNKTQIFLDIRCTEAATAKGLCAGAKAEEIRTRFTDMIKTKLAAPAPAAPATPAPAIPAPATPAAK